MVDNGVTHTPWTPPTPVLDVVDDGTRLTNGRVYADMAPGVADGIRSDVDGNVWSSGGWGGEGYDGVDCYGPDGMLMGQIHLPEPCSNLCFGGIKKNRLFMTAGQSPTRSSWRRRGRSDRELERQRLGDWRFEIRDPIP